MKPARIVAIVHSDTDVPGSLPELFAEQGVDLEIRSITRPLIAPEELTGLVVMGSPESAYDSRLPWLASELAWLREVQRKEIPTWGICFGSQLLSRALGGSVHKNSSAEIGWTPLTLLGDEWGHEGPWLNFHFDAFTVPPDATLLAKTDLAPQVFKQGKAIGMQFHPEIDTAMFDTWTRYWSSTEEGKRFLQTAGDLPERMRAEIQDRQPDNKTNCRNLVKDFLDLV
ncbi:type 1 glutamine amidotransferase [Pseudomonas guariconensis]|uniref:type 1 glutamine amidotransferase n=1 Tax=Pseudomonas guariconensis TaxID=1288410 RepID=UPI0018A9012F|nr:type 1 glutamine amidotransferase [Pseudomonas guariconensis]MBF8728928.1 type 1 glutamine amidotransferase [Pseudomonas guariconensis]